MNAFDLAGLSGFCLYVGAYGLLQLGKIDGNSMRYSLFNAGAAFLVLISLTQHFNLASALIQIMWIGISVVGVFRLMITRRNASRYFCHPAHFTPGVRKKGRVRVKKWRRVYRSHHMA